MSEPFVAEIKMFAGNFAPRGYAFCNGQLLPISQNTALFSLIGTTYGGDGRTTTALPNLQGRAPMHPGRGPGLTSRRLGEKLGTGTVTLTEGQMPSHSHTLQGAAEAPNNNNPAGSVPAQVFGRSGGTNLYGSNDGPTTPMLATALAPAGGPGGGQPHNNIQPSLGINFIIALVGTYPSRN